ncbi:VOC family protein [Streptomyces sp. NPDC050610]|uniref:VOC family protein n=1 Tax=Streptomyces sp. NPDC050610 TaxID=3157097 RepID=UPI003413F925
MATRLVQIAMNAQDDSALGRFWAEALGWDMTSERPNLRPYPGGDQAAEADRLRALGATDIDLGQGDVPWTCLIDLEGNEFCVLTPR